MISNSSLSLAQLVPEDESHTSIFYTRLCCKVMLLVVSVIWTCVVSHRRIVHRVVRNLFRPTATPVTTLLHPKMLRVTLISAFYATW